MAAAEDVVLQWRLPIATSRAKAWDLLADTDRVNRVAGLHHQYQEKPRADGGVDRFGHSNRLGISLDWHEEPFDWVAPVGYGVRRVFLGGPADRYTVRVRLEDDPSGDSGRCLLDYHVSITPRSVWTRPIVLAELALLTRPALDRTLQRAIAVLEGRLASFDLAPPPLSAMAERRLQAGLSAIEDPTLRVALGELLRHEAAAELRAIAPLRLARRWRLGTDATIRACLQAVRGGLLQLRWTLRCPSCRVSKAEAPRLSAERQQVHCPSCNIAFDGSLPDSLVVTLSPDPRVRDVDDTERCIGSPGRTAHIRASQLVEIGAELDLELALLPGSYRLRTLPALGAASLQVRADRDERALAVDLTPQGPQPPLLRAAPGRMRLALRNRSQVRLQFLIERLDDDPDLLTVGRLLEVPEAISLLPTDAIAQGVSVQTTSAIVLAVRRCRGGDAHCKEIVRALQSYQPDLLVERGGAVIAAFGDPAVAVEAASLVEGAPHLGSGLCAGSIVTLVERDEALPLGYTVQRALALASGGGELRTPRADADRAPLLQALAREGIRRSAASVDADNPQEASLQLRIGPPLRSSPALREQPQAPPPVAGDCIAGRFRVIGPLGSGGFGMVLRARDERAPPGQPDGAVIKLLHPALADDLTHLQRFYNEGRLAARVQSPAVARVLDYGVDELGRVYVASQLLDGEELSARLRRLQVLDPWQALMLCRDVAVALREVHAAQLVHRDIKPGNILVVDPPAPAAPGLGAPHPTLVDPRPCARLIDFGIAKAEGEALAVLAADAVVVGTPQYMAPEQASARPADGRADLFALGVVLFECLTGRLPFVGRSAFEQLTARLQDDALALSKVSSETMPPGVEELLASLMARDSNLRLPSAEALIAAIDRIVLPIAADMSWRERRGPSDGAATGQGADAMTIALRDSAITTADTEPEPQELQP